ncbi:MAG: phosphate acyltransferase [Rikenellaceae bacterium]
MKSLSQIIDLVKTKEKKVIAVAYAQDAHTLEAVSAAVDLGIVNAILIGDRHEIQQTADRCGIDLTHFTIQEEKTDVACVDLAVSLVKSGKADILMKGLVSTDKYMRGILNKERGLVPPRATLSHVVVLEIPAYHKLLIISDVAILPQPDLKQKIQLVGYVSQVARSLGIETPKVALVTPTEQVLPSVESSIDAAIISQMWRRGQISGAIVDGPLALDVAIDKETVDIKKLESPVDGDADCLVFPSLEAANVFFKSATKLMGAELAAMVVGASAPCVLTSRGDSQQSKLYSIALAALSAR